MIQFLRDATTNYHDHRLGNFPKVLESGCQGTRRVLIFLCLFWLLTMVLYCGIIGLNPHHSGHCLHLHSLFFMDPVSLNHALPDSWPPEVHEAIMNLCETLSEIKFLHCFPPCLSLSFHFSISPCSRAFSPLKKTILSLKQKTENLLNI